ncbi:DUF1127 domain-containing protein [Leisingera sp. M527]|uniref:DUF1127 domain-containing protein n=1 Tax=unclassified Leisingera TaxID=2614906 RepID=UPI00101033BD|nr:MULTISPECIES: DUF1127 domain-containing protein [unclassified Leisingera]MBQ4825245.1 DUF1127 domain-containing protein [Leisingera sp. HS039]MCF6432035.1 DUF1127 domain-containing protein [Leisingera sp. MMG026]QAX30254.1 DUF1127 domain-containing protein [Leisingera sp. NJS204]QBR35824.1 DUF1127 domain-containing protein [Leisingera sp. NJS201]UWQ27515.1 DUF1127 domain-containing protein [Leisingera sp. M523]
MAAAQQISAVNIASPVGFLDALMVKFVRYRLYRKTVNELSALTARDLADLGLNRSEIQRVAYQAAYENN